jgi:RimJ/RimL family protein N-acetyltransferase
MTYMISLRHATEADAVHLFQWRNDEQTRAASVSQDPVGWEEHSAWFRGILGDGRRILYMAFQADQPEDAPPIGMCRFDQLDQQTFEMSINLDPEFRGKGLAGPVLQAAVAKFRAEEGALRLTATVRRENLASSRIFIRAGFAESSADVEYLYYVAEAE